ncbi:hypothetical protein D7X33_18160 [Butyricicoccus sp. 1XD8-22]|nr:hypothetical protein D7X33_18160 [Butyricicoccus sp. 1XD8-22]
MGQPKQPLQEPFALLAYPFQLAICIVLRRLQKSLPFPAKCAILIKQARFSRTSRTKYGYLRRSQPQLRQPAFLLSAAGQLNN